MPVDAFNLHGTHAECAANNNPRLDRSIFENCTPSTRPSPLIVHLVEAFLIHQLLAFSICFNSLLCLW